jgi:bifunctional non-homologous end joining protein LigD
MARRSSERAQPQTAPLPDALVPELATLTSQAPAAHDEWSYELKYDGYRMLARIEDDIRLISRNGNDWTAKLGPLRDELSRIALPAGWYDGEIVVLDERGQPDFGLLQNAFDYRRVQSIVYFLFDAPFLDGADIRELPLTSRRAKLETVLSHRTSETVRFSPSLNAPPNEIIVAACQMGLEGLIGKRKDSRYVGRRSPDWIKLKCGQRQEFVIGGYTDPDGARTGFGSLLLGTYDTHGRLVYAGSVGTGFDAKAQRAIFKLLAARESNKRPFSPHKELHKAVHWVLPELVAEVSFAEWTHTGSIRHASFRGIRSDKHASSILREHHADPPAAAAGPFRKHHWNKTSGAAAKTPERAAKSPPEPIEVTNGDRFIDPSSGATKLDLVTYYASIADLMLPHLAGRPTSLVRAPAGITKALFFQKHAASVKLAGVTRFPAEINPGHEPMIAIESAKGLLATARWNVVEYHTQNACGTHYQCPDRMIFDLDPGEGVTWQQIQEAATLVRSVIEHMGLIGCLKTSGGKGLHIDVPLQPKYGWDTVRQVSKAIVAHMASVLPDRFVVKSGPANRKQKIFIDYLRNGRGATTACAWSARARPGPGVSVPVEWSELEGLRSGDQWNIANIAMRLPTGNAPWAGYEAAAATLDETLEMLEFGRPRRHR